MSVSMNNSIVGMSSLQQKIDSISNNIANINTTGYKSREVQFHEILTSRLDQPNNYNNLEGRLTPKGLDTGYGSKLSLTLGNFSQGPQIETGLATDFMLTGENIFFSVSSEVPYNDNGMRYTRDGNFHLDANGNLVTANGDYVLNSDGDMITIPEGGNFEVDNQGRIVVKYNSGETEEIGSLGIIKINNPQVLEEAGSNQFKIPDELLNQDYSVIDESFNILEGTNGVYNVYQGSLEGSNVDFAKEMTQLNEAQRNYQLLSRSISISDQMYGIANNLRG